VRTGRFSVRLVLLYGVIAGTVGDARHKLGEKSGYVPPFPAYGLE
jgi:hypothetical protein